MFHKIFVTARLNDAFNAELARLCRKQKARFMYRLHRNRGWLPQKVVDLVDEYFMFEAAKALHRKGWITEFVANGSRSTLRIKDPSEGSEWLRCDHLDYYIY